VDGSDHNLKNMSVPLVSVFDINSNADVVVSQTTLPDVLTSPIRSDVVQITHSLISKNKRQPYAVYKRAGHEVIIVIL